jgi:PPM family protein phosphatase
MVSTTHAGLSDVGQIRQENQDRWFVDTVRGIYMVADGMAGIAAGGLAAQIVVEVLPRLLCSKLDALQGADDSELAQQILTSIVELSNRLRREGEAQVDAHGLGSTVVLAIVRECHAIIAHLGDSRAYRLHDANLKQLTEDHSIVQLLVETGEITAEEARQHPARGQLTRYVGMQSEPFPNSTVVNIVPGDRLLLCSDGLHGTLNDATIGAILRKHSAPEAACRRLIATANETGGPDNTTAVVVAISDVDS